MLPTAQSFINIHSHHKPKLHDEFVMRNAYLRLHSDSLNQLPYAVSVGLHPWFINQYSIDKCADLLLDLATHEKVLAIGEIGLDKAIEIPLSKQLSYFEAQLNVARALKKPIIIHAVKTYSDFIPFLKKAKVPFIFHQFQGNEQQAKELLKYDALLSFGKNLFEPKIENYFKHLPNGNIFLETDTASHLHIGDIYNKAAELRGIELDELKSIVFNNFNRIRIRG